MRSALFTGIVGFFLIGCLPKAKLEGDLFTYTNLPTDSPSATYAEVVCPDDETPDDPLTGRLFHSNTAGTDSTLMEWMGGSSAYMNSHGNSWRYTPETPGIRSWLGLAKAKDVNPGTAYFFLEDMGGGLWFGNLVLVPDDGTHAYRFAYLDRGSGKMKVTKVGEAYQVQPIPQSIPMGGITCYEQADESWPRRMAPSMADLSFMGPPDVRTALSQGDADEAVRLWHASGFADLLRYGGEEIRGLVAHWVVVTQYSDFLPIDSDETENIADSTWAEIQAKYQAVVDSGKGPPADLSQAAPAPEDETLAPEELQ